MTKQSRGADRDPSGIDGPTSRFQTKTRRRLLLGPALAVIGLLSAPAQALPPDDATSDRAIPGDRYVYPPPPGVAEPVPSGWWRAPAAVFDLLVVRPVMAAGLVAGAGLSLVALPFQAPTSVTDDTVETLADQSLSTFTRPVGEF